MKIYMTAHWCRSVVYGVVVVVGMVAILALVMVLMVQTRPVWDVWIQRHTRVIGSKFFQSELPFPEDLQPIRQDSRQTTNQHGEHIMIRRPKGIDLDPKSIDKVKLLNDGKPKGPLARRVPQCILLGFGKCGTSALLEFLDLHPNIVTLDWEPDYFCDRMYPKYDLQWYVKKMPPSFPDQMTIEKSPCYIVEHDSHIRMHAMNHTLKLMVLVRDPVVRVLSEYGHYAATERYWGRIPTPLINRITLKSRSELNSVQLLKTGNYLPHLEHLLGVFPREQLLVLDGDALISDPLSQIRQVEKFLGLPHLISSKSIYFDQDKGFYCMVSPVTGEPKCLGASKGRQHEPMDGALKARLAEFYRPYNSQLFTLLGHTFQWL